MKLLYYSTSRVASICRFSGYLRLLGLLLALLPLAAQASSPSGSNTFPSVSLLAAAPTLTAVAPNPGGLGQSITLTGTNLGSPTALTINGANALGNIISSTSTALVVRVPVTAAASGSISITTADGTASISFTVMAAPGNALALDGSDDYVRVPDNSTLDFGAGDFTVEAWVYKGATVSSYSNSTIAGKWNTGASLGTNEWLLHTTTDGANNIPSFWVESGTTIYQCEGTKPLPLNRWYHLAGVRQGSSLLLYVNGVLQGMTAIPAAAALNNVVGRDLLLGAFGNAPGYFTNERLDELRLWKEARTAAQLLAGMTTVLPASTSNLIAYYNFDAGIPGGTNTGLTTLYDLTANANHGALNNFTLSGPTSNWVESYAMVVPTAIAATAAVGTGFTANWTAPAVGVVNSYLLDVSTAADFSAPIASSPFTVTGATSRNITGLSSTTTYYYRVRADKATVTGQGAYSNTISVCPPPIAVAQNVTLPLDASGNATLAATAVNNGSTANCTLAAPSSLSVSPSTFSCADVVPATVASSLSFNGTNQYVSIPATAAVPIGNSTYTIEAWIKPTAMGNYGIIGWGNYGTMDQVNALRLTSTGIINYWWMRNLSSPTANLAGAWHHVAATFDGTTRRLYLDGIQLSSDMPGNTHAVPNANNLRIGLTNGNNNNNEYFPGSIDEVRVWNVARTQAQLSTTKGIGLPGSSAGLVAYYRLNEGSGLTTADATGNAANVGTLVNGPTWTTDAPGVVNGLPVTLTVTDGGGNTSTAAAIVTVLDNTGPAAAGSGPLPAAPTLATSNVPEAGGYGVLYQLDMPNVAAFNSLAAIPYTVNNSGAAIAQPARVAYFMELTNGLDTKWVWASMDNFATTLAQLGLPNPTANNQVWDQNVNNLNVYASSNTGLVTGNNVGTGRLEMWRFNYTANNFNSVPNASSSTFDFGDQNSGVNNYGSFQVHNVTAQQTLLAYNRWGGGSGKGDIGIGNQVGGSGNPDWTYAYNADSYSVKRIYILVPNSSFTQPASVALGADGTATVLASQVYAGNATDNCTSASALSVAVTPSVFSCTNVGPNTVVVTLTDANGNASTQTAVVTVTVPPTPTTTWTGGVSTAWTDCQNWSFGKVPDAVTNAIVPVVGNGRYPNLSAGIGSTKDITLASGASLTVASTANLQVNGNWTNNGGTASLPGTVTFTGSMATQNLGGTASTTFGTLEVNKATGTVQLGQNIPITTALNMTSGTLTTATNQVSLGTAASIIETETSYVIGRVTVTRTVTAGSVQSFSGVGLTLTPAAGSASPGNTLVARTTGTPLTGVGSSQSVQRYFDIQPAVNSGLNITMDFAYFTHELNTIPTVNLRLFKSATALTGPWILQRNTTASTNVVTKTGITDFSIWTLGNSANPLPVELTAFTATAEGDAAVRLAWTTASEKNSDRFEVERSLNGTAFERIGTVAAQGAKATTTNYALLDGKLPAGAGMLYYRLRQVDADGTFAYSPVRVVTLTPRLPGKLTLAPNPARATTLAGAQPGAPVNVYDALGRLVLTATADAAGTAALALPARLATGVYVVRSGTQAVRLVVE